MAASVCSGRGRGRRSGGRGRRPATQVGRAIGSLGSVSVMVAHRRSSSGSNAPRLARRHRRPGSGGAASLADDPPPLPLGRAAPDAVLLPDGEGVLEAGLAHRAAAAHGLGDLRLLVGDRVEHLGVEPSARGVLTPGLVHRREITPWWRLAGRQLTEAGRSRLPGSTSQYGRAAPTVSSVRTGNFPSLSSVTDGVPLDASTGPPSRSRLADRFDVLVVGGGGTGAGVALDAASRGLRTALVERDDFASGTSSRSSKLIHGGLRYLQRGEVRLVYQALAERTRLQRNAPHLVKPLPFLMPLFARDGLVNRKLARGLGSALWMYDATGGVRIGKLHQRLSTDEALGYMPTLRGRPVAGRLPVLRRPGRRRPAHARPGPDRGHRLRGRPSPTGMRVTGSTTTPAGRSSGARAVDDADRRRGRIGASAVVNATGVWSDEMRALDDRRPGRAGAGRPRASTSPCRGTG